MTYDLLSSEGAVTEGKFWPLVLSDVNLTSACCNIKRMTKLHKENFDRIKLWLDPEHSPKAGRLFLYGVKTEEIKGRDHSLYFPILRWVTRKPKVMDLTLHPEPNSFQQTFTSLPEVHRHETLFFLVLATSAIAAVTCFLPQVEKDEASQWILSTIAGSLTGLLVLSVSLFFFRVLIVKREAVIAFRVSSTAFPGPSATAKFASLKLKLFGSMIVVSLILLVVVAVFVSGISPVAANAWSACTLIATTVVIVFWLLVTKGQLYTRSAKVLVGVLKGRRRAAARQSVASSHKSDPIGQDNLIAAASTVDEMPHAADQALMEQAMSRKRKESQAQTDNQSSLSSASDNGSEASSKTGEKKKHKKSSSSDKKSQKSQMSHMPRKPEEKEGKKKTPPSTASDSSDKKTTGTSGSSGSPAVPPSSQISRAKRRNSASSSANKKSTLKSPPKTPFLQITTPVHDVPSTRIPEPPTHSLPAPTSSP